MKINPLLLLGFVLLHLTSCQYESVENLYQPTPVEKPNFEDGLLAHINFNDGIKDEGPSRLAVAIQGETNFIVGAQGETDQAIHLSGYPQYLSINGLGEHEVMSIFLWFKSDAELEETATSTLFDYGMNGFSAKIDGTTGATRVVATHNQEEAMIETWINSYNVWNFLYAESGSGAFKVKYQGAIRGGEIIEMAEEISCEGTIFSELDIMYIGRSITGENTDASYFKGGIDNIRIYNKSLSPIEIKSLIHE